MIFFLNYDGTLTRQDTGRIYQGSTAVPEIKVLSGVSNASSVLEVAFTLPNGLVTQYFPLTQQGEYEQDGIKAFLWSLELATDILANVTEQVGKVGVSVRQVNVINNTVVASYTATFDVEYSALPYTPTEYTPADTQELIDLLGAYYNQNQTLIDSIQGDYESVVGRLDEQGEDITNLESDVDKLEELTDKPLLINITTDVEAGVGTKYYNDGTTATFEIGTDVATSKRGNFMTEISFLSTSLNWTQESDDTYSIVFSPATTERNDANCIVAVDRLDGNGYNQTANGVLKGSDGSLALYGVATPFDGKLLVLAGGGAGTKIWTLPVRVGEEISGLSFDTASTPDVRGDIFPEGNTGIYEHILIKVGEMKITAIKNGEEETSIGVKGLRATNNTSQTQLVWRTWNFNEVFINEDENEYSIDGVECTYEEAVSAVFNDVETVVYNQYIKDITYPTDTVGWLVDGLTFDKTYTLEEVNNYDKWEDYIGVSNKSTLYDKALIGDYYLDEATGDWFLCVGKTDTSIDWEYLFTGKVSVNLNGTQTSKPVFFAPTSTRNANVNGSCWVLTPNGHNAPAWEQMTLETADNLTYTIKIGGKNVGSFTLTKEVFLDSVSYNPETKKLTFTYNTESGKASVDIDLSDLEEVQNALIATNETEFTAYQTEENVGKLVTYRGLLYIITESTPTTNAPIAVGDTIDKLYFNTSVTPDLSGLDYSQADGSALLIETELDDLVYQNLGVSSGGQVPDTAWVLYMTSGGTPTSFIYSSIEIAEYGLVAGWQNLTDGAYSFGESATVTVVQEQDLWSSYISKEPFGASTGGGVTARLVNEINSISCVGTNFHFSYKVGENEAISFQVPIDYVDAELVDELSYNDLTDQPILIGDLDAITPVANTYYKHNGADETTYTKGVIYFYDGSTFAPVTGGGGGVSDVQINGTSIVADGVANIPYANRSEGGLLNVSSTQYIAGTKLFTGNARFYKPTTSPTGVLSNYSQLHYDGGHVLSSNGTTPTLYLGGKNVTPSIELSLTGIVCNRSASSPTNFAISQNNLSGDDPYWYFDRNNQGAVMCAGSAWSTGTSGSVTLPSAGLYEFKVADVNGTIHSFIVNWDGSTKTMSTMSLTSLTASVANAMFLNISATGVISVSINDLRTADGGTDTSLTISYRKIGIA